MLLYRTNKNQLQVILGDIMIEELNEEFKEIKLTGNTVTELLDFENQDDYKKLNTDKKSEYLKAKAKIEKTLSKKEQKKNIRTKKIKNIHTPIYNGIDYTALVELIDKIFYDEIQDKYYNTDKRNTFPPRSLGYLIEEVIDTYAIDDSVIGPYGSKIKYQKKLIKDIGDSITLNKSYRTIGLLQNPYITEKEVKIKGKKLEITEPLHLTEPRYIKSENYKQNTEFWEEYANFNEELDWICAARFATTRRKCFLWQRFPSGWGKTYKASIYKELGIQQEVDTYQIAKIIDGQPSGISAEDLYDKWIMFFDEFKFAGSSLKKINEEISINQKYSSNVNVKIYAKIFTSAEGVKSLTGGGLEEQFRQRYLFQNKQNTEIKIQKLEDYELFSENKNVFTHDLVIYAYEIINNNIKMYRNLGEIEGSKKADKFIDEMYEKYKYQGRSLEEIITEQLHNLKEELTEIVQQGRDQDQISYDLKKIMNQLYVKGDKVYVNTLGKCEEAIYDWMYIGNDRKKIGYKSLCEMSDFPCDDIVTDRVSVNSKRLYLRFWFDTRIPKADYIGEHTEELTEWENDIKKISTSIVQDKDEDIEKMKSMNDSLCKSMGF